ncbi:MAG: mitochondrial fission ELM1 family protein [Candidatus Omnitrophica bacterium]|nr:mitochondrial fission ELM1 family protein [Candidatus Omnitrophota bacterium]MBU4487847.1 mitochondrial fission ELM1 family protein [Candidatus Omnitrophota bacterium]MCG2704630.1 mitochondrial fission ELM1 family protein [Candidatus Omnitrophota bacterium]
MLDYVLYLIANFASALFRILPVDTALAFGRGFGSIAYFVNYKRAKVAYSNMRAALGSEKEPEEIRRTVKRLYRNFGQMLVEILRLPDVDKDYFEKYIKVEGWHNFESAAKLGRGTIYLTGHFGNWELSSIASALRGFPLFVLAREQKMTRLNNLLNAARESKGCKVIKKGMATREIYEHLARNGIVGILSDQDAGKKGVFINFFARPTSSPRGAFALARKTGALIVPAFVVRRDGPYHTIFIEKPIALSSEGDMEANELEAMQRFGSLLESFVRKSPEQWLWLHKRWKSTPLRKVVILTDGRAGHLNQSLAVFEKIKESRREFGYTERDTEKRVIEITYKSDFGRTLAALITPLISNYCLFRMKLLNLVLDPKCYDEIKSAYADIVISCGSRVAAVNILFSRENCAKSIALMKPSLLSVRNFDINIIPEHDRPAERENIVKTLGMPNLISQKKMADDLKQLERIAELGNKENIGLFIGGDNKNYSLDKALVEDVIEKVLGAAHELDANILATTSRRTSNEVNNLLKTKLGKDELAKLVIISAERNPEWAIGGILGASSVVVVSGESTSMLSEAASSGKHVIAFKPNKKLSAPAANKHELFLKKMASKGHICLSEVKDLKDNIVGLMDSDEEPKRLNDNEKIYEAVKRIV